MTRLLNHARRLAIEQLEVRTMLAAFDVLVFSKTAGFRHSSIDDGIAAIQALGAANDFTVTAIEDANAFNAANLANFEAVVFLNTTGDVLNATQQAAFEQYIQAGGGWVGVHSAADTEYSWPWYGELLGAYFESHPAIQQATIVVEDDSHPSTAHLPNEWIRTDEWYNFQTNPRGQVNVLATLDESTYSGGADGPDHPIAWYHQYDGGRAWYTGLGHTDASYSEPLFREHLLGGIQYAAGQAPSDSSADFDEDGAVDGDDFLQWQRGLGISSGAMRADGDANLDGRVDADDLGVWKDQFGPTNASAGAQGELHPTAADSAFDSIESAHSLASALVTQAALSERAAAASAYQAYADVAMEESRRYAAPGSAGGAASIRTNSVPMVRDPRAEPGAALAPRLNGHATFDRLINPSREARADQLPTGTEAMSFRAPLRKTTNELRALDQAFTSSQASCRLPTI